MRSPRPLAIIAAFLSVATSAPMSLFSQTAPKSSQPKQPAARQRQTKRSQRADALAPAINELLKLSPRTPESASEKDSENDADSSKEERKPPADDAPVEDLIAYWSHVGGSTDTKPSEKVSRRLLEAVEDRPGLIVDLINYLPETTETHDRLYKLLDEDQEDSGLKDFIRNWLQRNSRYFRGDLTAEARGELRIGNPPGYSLETLAKLDWEAARPIVEAFASTWNSQMTPVALSLLYERAQQDGDSAQTEKYRALLKAIVANRQAPHEARQIGISSLGKTEWDGQATWVVSLFDDPTLGGFKEGANDGVSKAASEEKAEKAESDADREETPNILYTLLDTNSERWLPVISNLVGHPQRTVHQSAVKCLATLLSYELTDKKLKTEIAQKLLPWLTDPNWASPDNRYNFIQSLRETQAPELTPGLIWILEHDEDQYNRAAAAEALIQYRDQSAIPAMRRALEKDGDEYTRERMIIALAQLGGFSDDEMAEAIEAYAQMVVTKAGELERNRAEIGDSEKPVSLKVSIGRVLSDSESIQATEGLTLRLIERAKSLRESQPAVARQILRSFEGTALRVAEANLVERIGVGWADLDALKLAVENRRSLRMNAGDELYDLIKQGGYAAGVAAVILDDEREQKETLAGTDTKSQLALIAGARYLRDKLPIELVGRLLDAPDRALAKAAESYLEIEDSAEARKLFLARHRGPAYILGDNSIMAYGPFLEAARKWEETIRKEIKSAAGLETIYALAGPMALETSKAVIIRVRDGKAEISVHEVAGRREFRLLTESEFEELKSFTSRQEVEDLGPETYNLVGRKYEYLRLTKDGGRRIILDKFRRAPKNPTLHEELSGLFHRLSVSGDFITRYEIEDKIPGVEILLADKKQEAMSVCGEGREIRALMAEKGVEYKRGIVEAMPEWREFSSGKPGMVTDEPSACRAVSWSEALMKINLTDYFLDANFPSISGDALIYSTSSKDPGVWKLERGAEPAKIVSGHYLNPIVTPDGKWLVAIKMSLEAGKDPRQLIRHNLQTGEEFQVTTPGTGYPLPITYVAAHGKALIGVGRRQWVEYLGEVKYLLDPETGMVQQVKGQFSPLKQRAFRELQPTGNPNEFWAAIYDSNDNATHLGRYDSRNFVFTPVVKLPGLTLSSDDFWVDAAAGKIWLTYSGHLLRIPLPAKSK